VEALHNLTVVEDILLVEEVEVVDICQAAILNMLVMLMIGR
jgi:hypothetical protein